jgi:hypothetical protein
MRPALDSAGHRVPRTKPTCLLHIWRPHQQRPFALVLHLHQHQSSHNLHLQYLAKNQSAPRCQSLNTPGSDHPPVLEPHSLSLTSMLLADEVRSSLSLPFAVTGAMSERRWDEEAISPRSDCLAVLCGKRSSYWPSSSEPKKARSLQRGELRSLP